MFAAHFGKKRGVPPAALIAIIDDDLSMLNGLVGLVRSAGYDVRGFASAATPLIMITALHDPGLEERALTSGAVCFLQKPFEADTFIGCIEKALKT